MKMRVQQLGGRRKWTWAKHKFAKSGQWGAEHTARATGTRSVARLFTREQSPEHQQMLRAELFQQVRLTESTTYIHRSNHLQLHYSNSKLHWLLHMFSMCINMLILKYIYRV